MTKKPEEKPSKHLTYRSPELKNYPIFDDEDDLFGRLKGMGRFFDILMDQHSISELLIFVNHYNDTYYKRLQPELVSDFYENIGEPITLYRSEILEEKPPIKVSKELEEFIYNWIEEEDTSDLSKVFVDKHNDFVIYNRATLIELSDGRLVSANAILDELGRCYYFKLLPVFEKSFFEEYKKSCRDFRTVKDSEGKTRREAFYRYSLYSLKIALEENETRLMAERRGEGGTKEALQETKSSRGLLARLFRRK